MTNTEIATKICDKEITFDPSFIKSNNLDKDTVKAIRDEVKAIRRQRKEDAFKAENCTVVYGKNTLAFNPKGCVVTKKDKEIPCVMWNNVDRNSIIIAYENEEKLVFVSLTRVGSSSKMYEHNKRLVSANTKKCIELMETVTEGMTPSQFFDRCKTFKNYKEVNAPASVKEYFLGKKGK